jgi:NhaP-type Na+/H+ or K+/H+ antiporter
MSQRVVFYPLAALSVALYFISPALGAVCAGLLLAWSAHRVRRARREARQRAAEVLAEVLRRDPAAVITHKESM